MKISHIAFGLDPDLQSARDCDQISRSRLKSQVKFHTDPSKFSGRLEECWCSYGNPDLG